MFEANKLTRTVVVLAQMVMTTFLLATYIVHPKAMHRFVGYLEECGKYELFCLIRCFVVNDRTDSTSVSFLFTCVSADVLNITMFVFSFCNSYARN